MALMLEQIDDFVANTISNFKRGRFTDIYQRYQNYVSSRIMKDKVVTEQGGANITFNLKKSATGNARTAGLYDVNRTNVTDVMIQGTIPWKFLTTSWAYDIYEDIFQTDRETIVRQLMVREMDAKFDMVELNETLMWNAPSGSSDTRPWSLPFWMQADSSSSASEGDFTGGNPTGFSAGAAGVDSDTYPNWKNYAFNYVSTSTDDLIRKIKRALVYTNFQAPVPHPTIGFGEASTEIYTTYRVIAECEALAETRNDRLGSDLARFIGQTTIGGVPMRTVMYLEANDSADPLYGVDWSAIRPFIRKGCNMRKQGPYRAPNQRNVREVHYDTAMNYACYDRRKLWRAKRVS